MKFTKVLFSVGLVVVFMLSSVNAFAAGGIVVYGTTERVTDMDSANAYDFHTWEIFQNIYEGLMGYTPGTTELAPGVAESYTISEDGKEYTFKLREGVKFTDGTPLTAEVVKWSVDRTISLGGNPSWLASDFVDSIEVVDELSVKFILKILSRIFQPLLRPPRTFR
jgi:peptide/nickel transport system substrate-binding protein